MITTKQYMTKRYIQKIRKLNSKFENRKPTELEYAIAMRYSDWLNYYLDIDLVKEKVSRTNEFQK